jgi:putative tryptophan/tyrosine transport system substrate-binding protein
MTLWPGLGNDPSPIVSRPTRLALVFLACLLLSGPALAQPTKPARVGWATVSPLNQIESLTQAFRSGLTAHGYVEGQNLESISRSADGAPERAPAVIEELVRLKPDVIVVHAAATFSARQVTTVPVVFGFSGDPIAAGLTDSLARPNGNLTGVTFMQVELNEKRLDLLRQIAPRLKTVVLMGSPVHPGADLEVAVSETMQSNLA